MKNNKTVFLVLGIVFLGNMLRKALLGISSPMPSEPYSTDIFSLIIILILITAVGFLVNQRNWRFLCMIVGVDKILMQVAPLTSKHMNLALQIFSILLAAVGFMNLRYFYKDEVAVPKMPNRKLFLVSVGALILLFLIIFTIFLFHGRN